MSERTPESLVSAATPPSEPGHPNPANMSMEPEAPEEIEFEWVPVSSWSSNVSHHNEDNEDWEAVQRDIDRISGLLRTLEAKDRSVPPTAEYARAVNVLYDALAGRRHELSVMILKIQKLPLPDDEVLPPAERPA